MLEFVGEIEMYCKFPDASQISPFNCRNEVAQGLVCSLSILKGETSAQAAVRKHGLTVAEMEEWRDRFADSAPPNLRVSAALGLARRVETKALTSYLLLMTVPSHFLQFLSGFNIGESPAPLVPEMFLGEGRIGSAFA